MNLLFISSLLPDEVSSSGFEIANQAIVDEYRRQGVRLRFAGFRRIDASFQNSDAIELGRLVIENAAADPAQKLAWIANAFRKGLPVGAAKLAIFDEKTLAARLAAAGPVDGYILNSIQMPAAFPSLARAKPSIFIAHNAEHRSAAENAVTAPSASTRFLYRREARLLKKAETRMCAEARVVHTLARDDLAAFGLAESARATAMPLAIGRPARTEDGVRSHDIGLIGTWSWAPNRAGLDWFVNAVVPHLPAELSIAVAGRFDGAPPSAPGNVSFLGRVPDAQAFVGASRVMALAARGGTGVQLKTIECFEEGLPAVATSSALRGVDHLPGNVHVADDAAGFAAALTAMVAAERDGRIGRLDGRHFRDSQRRALSAAIRNGLTAFETSLSRTASAHGARPAPAGGDMAPYRGLRSEPAVEQ